MKRTSMFVSLARRRAAGLNQNRDGYWNMRPGKFIEETEYKSKPIRIGSDGRCQRSCADACPLGRHGSMERCTEAELRVAENFMSSSKTMTVKEFLASRSVDVEPYDFLRFDVQAQECDVTVAGVPHHHNSTAREFTYASPMQEFMDGMDSLFDAIRVAEDGTVSICVEFG